MTEHFITEIEIDKLRHIENINIALSEDKRQHLILTGKNGSGKTSVLQRIKALLSALNRTSKLESRNIYNIIGKNIHITISFNQEKTLSASYNHGDFITAFFPAVRPVNDITEPKGVEEVTLKPAFTVEDDPAKDIAKYMVHLKTQQLYAKDANDTQTEQNIEAWFKRFEDSLKILMNDDSIRIKYEYKKYSFEIQQDGREQVNFNHLSDGYASVFRIFADLIMRMDQNWLLNNQLSKYNKEGVVLIDEIETHLHLELQRTVLPSLIKLFPRVQFIISTHSPYVATSVSNALIYDLERQTALTNLSSYSVDDVAEGFFEAESYSVKMEETLRRYKELLNKKDATDAERAERANLRMELNEVPGKLAVAIRAEFDRLEQEQ